jgi:hypothetical protein
MFIDRCAQDVGTVLFCAKRLLCWLHSSKALILCEELFLIAAFKQSAESANYGSQGQVPVLQGTSPLVAYEIRLER